MKKSVAIIGGGPAGMMLAACLDSSLYDVTIYEKNKSFGRKFLVAGKGGFNVTHGENIGDFLQRYTPNNFLETALRNFNNEDLRTWLKSIGIPTFIGSSHRIYPEKGIKPIEVLNQILDVLTTKGIHFQLDQEWKGWDQNNQLIFQSGDKVNSDIVAFALGGGSWKVTGSDGSWLTTFQEKGIETKDFVPANCAYQIDWSKEFLKKNAGQPLKNIALTCADKTQKGELVITDFGLEGNAIYALSPQIQNELDTNGKAQIYLDLKPPLTVDRIKEKLEKSKMNTTDSLDKELKLSRPQIDLIKTNVTKEEFINPSLLAAAIKALPLIVLAAAELDEAISTTGGIALDQIDENNQLNKLSNHYCLGEMLDWNAPTGGYLLQACFSMGAHLAKHLNGKK
tara:strand:- start:9229 stop:10416 length:1188 start_codon:yes stop_codon:yes gene_type:complete